MLRDEHREPDLGPFDYYLEAFGELSSTRQLGMAAGPIPFTAIAEYFSLYPIGEFEHFRYLIRRMDLVYLTKSVASGKDK